MHLRPIAQAVSTAAIALALLSRRPVRARLLDAAMQSQDHRAQRARAARWAFHPLPLHPVPHALPCAARFAALVLTSHTRSDGTGAVEMDLLTHLCGQTPQQLGGLLGQLVRSRFLSSWRDVRAEDEVSWQLGAHRRHPSTAGRGITPVAHETSLRKGRPATQAGSTTCNARLQGRQGRTRTRLSPYQPGGGARQLDVPAT